MTFKLLIYFIGLIAFVPSRDGKELTVLLVETRPGQVASDGSLIAPHHAMLLARAADCWGHCGIRDSTLGGLFFPLAGAAKANDLLSDALGKKGAAWRLDGSELSIVDAGQEPAPTVLKIHNGDRDAGTDFSSIADLGRIVPSAGIADPDLLASRPPKRLIAARLRLLSGKVWTYRLVGPCILKPLRDQTQGGREKAAPPQALADWVAAEVDVSGDSVEIVENRFGREGIRTIRLAPQDGLVELAVMNFPPPPAQPSADEPHAAHEPAAHFERYYDLALNPPPPDQRPVPQLTVDGPQPSSLQKLKPRSGLLEALKLGDPKGFYERVLCPPAQLSEADSP